MQLKSVSLKMLRKKSYRQLKLKCFVLMFFKLESAVLLLLYKHKMEHILNKKYY